MPSQTIPARRRRQPLVSGDEDDVSDFTIGSLNGTSSSKRARTNGYSDNHDSDDNTNEYGGNSRSRSDEDPDEHQPGAIVKVKLTNFVTYESAAFYPGPNLNMVIGPNGVGKSSLVCAICLGLGWGTKVLGRAEKIGAFVKHGEDEATIEIELKGRPEDSRNPLIRVLILKDGDKRKWWINNRETSEKAVQALVHGLSIQVDNLCQFLPQEKVSEFARQTPVELLHATQRAAAPPQMLEWHDQLKTLRNKQRGLERRHESDQELRNNLEGRQQGLQHDVAQLHARQAINERIAELEKKFPFVEYRVGRAKFKALKEQKQAAQRHLAQLERELEPSLRAVNEKQVYRDQIQEVVTDRSKALRNAERAADGLVAELNVLDDKIKEYSQKRDAEVNADAKRKQDMQKLQAKIRQLEVQYQNSPPEFDSVAFNDRVREKDVRSREIEAELRQIRDREAELSQQGKEARVDIATAEKELQALDSQAGQQHSKLLQFSRDTSQAWDWIQENQDKFEQQVFGPVLTECTVTDSRFADAIEGLFQRNDLTAFTVQSRNDFRTLQEQLYGKMKLADISIKTCSMPLQNFNPPLPVDQMKALGLDGWALQFVKGPDPVLAMLCSEQKLHETGVSLNAISEQQLGQIQRTRITSWVAGPSSYRITRRPQYGPDAFNITTKNVRPGRVWKDQPVDVSGNTEVQARLDALKEHFNKLKEEILPLRAQKTALNGELEENEKAKRELRDEKAELQRLKSQHDALPVRIDREKQTLQERRAQGEDVKRRVQDIALEHDKRILEKGSVTLRYKNQLAVLWRCHQDLMEAQIRLTEATSDVEALTGLNSGIQKRLQDERAAVAQADRESKAAKQEAQRLMAVAMEIMAEMEDSTAYMDSIPEDATIEGLQNQIDAEKAQLDYVQAGNSNAIKEFERRQVELDKLIDKMKEVEGELAKVGEELAAVRRLWEPELDKLVHEINDAFSTNFAKMGCAGEVSIHKDEDFDKWAIDIKVKFRENDTLQRLDHNRQSGGERSVSTVFYLMSLQSLAQAPFRLVDEINQGMDPRNERMVHERMVDIACKKYTSQYFLITPKLLTGLKYDSRMKVLCVVSGEYMPEDHNTLDLRSIINVKRNLVAAAG